MMDFNIISDRLEDLESERTAQLEAARSNKEALPSQVNRTKET
jgi:hypothetical protein